MNINTKKAKGNALLLLTAFIWGIAFVAQSAGMDYVGPFAFLFARSVLGGLVLIPCIFLMDHLTPEAEPGEKAADAETTAADRPACAVAACCFWPAACSSTAYSIQRWEKPDLSRRCISSSCLSCGFLRVSASGGSCGSAWHWPWWACIFCASPKVSPSVRGFSGAAVCSGLCLPHSRH